ncbi:MAG: glutathione S-transferase family protein [Alphaproteobacteria bacterium]|nr:glutathione S-transferase family protein [Alphaproteobacteria bacterium]
MKLYGVLLSPFARMCMVTALEAGLASRVQLINTEVKPTEVNAALAKISPIGKIPILETDHGHGIYDSRVIMEYFTHAGGNTSLLPHEGVKRFRILTLLALAQGMADAAVSLRYETFARPETARWPDYTKRTTERINACLDELEANWLVDLQSVTLGSIAVAVALGYIDFRHDALQWRKGRTGLSQFHENFIKRDSMVNTALGA